MIITHKFGKYGKFINSQNGAAITKGRILSFLQEHNCCLLSKGKKYLLREVDVLRQRNRSIDTTICNKARNTIQFGGLGDFSLL